MIWKFIVVAHLLLHRKAYLPLTSVLRSLKRSYPGSRKSCHGNKTNLTEAAAKPPLINLFTVKPFLLLLNVVGIISMTQQEKYSCSSLLVYSMLQWEMHQHTVLHHFFILHEFGVKWWKGIHDWCQLWAQRWRSTYKTEYNLFLRKAIKICLACFETKRSDLEYKFKICFHFWNPECQILSEIGIMNVFNNYVDKMKWSMSNLRK